MLLVSPLWATVAQGKNRFDPVRLVSVAETMYPVDTAVSGTVILQVTVEKAGGNRENSGDQWHTQTNGRS
jgi:hypothetical protein